MNNCPNHPDEETEIAHVSDAFAGDVYLDARVEYCPICYYIINSEVEVHG